MSLFDLFFGSADRKKLDDILARLETLMAGATDLQAKFDRMTAALANLADDVRRLTEAIKPGMTQAEVDAAVAQAETLASGLETLAAQTPEVPPSA
jgi:ABC-type transporter Mla subunit MlaD